MKEDRIRIAIFDSLLYADSSWELEVKNRIPEMLRLYISNPNVRALEGKWRTTAFKILLENVRGHVEMSTKLTVWYATGVSLFIKYDDPPWFTEFKEYYTPVPLEVARNVMRRKLSSSIGKHHV